MSAEFWVYLSTIIFLLLVIFKSYQFVIDYFSKQQNAIVAKLKQAEDVYNKAKILSDEYSRKISELDMKSDEVIQGAKIISEQIVQDADVAVAKMVEKKKQELIQKISDYELELKNKLLSQYALIVATHLQKTPISNDNLLIDNQVVETISKSLNTFS